LAQALGYLPLALEQAAAYMLAKNVSFAAYLRSYQQRRLRVIEKQRPEMGDYPESVAKTWAINFEAVKASSLAAADLLNLSAFLAPDNIPYELLLLGKAHLGELLSQALADAPEDELVLPDLLEELTRYSLIRLETDYRYSIHRMVQEVLRDVLDETHRQQWRERVVEALNQTFPNPEFQNWWQCERLVEQVQALEFSKLSPTVSLAWLLNAAGCFLHEQGRYREAEQLFVQALPIYQSQFGADHPKVTKILNHLALSYIPQERYTEAEFLCLQALEICRTQPGSEHCDTAIILNSLALSHKSEKHYSEAESLFLQALEICQSYFGFDHPNTASILDNLAQLYYSQKHYAKAEPLFLQALDIRRLKLERNHPDIAVSLNDLALLYYSQERYADAESLYIQALDIRKLKLGQSHPLTATSLFNLAVLYKSQERYAEAESLYLQAVSICFKQLVESHPNTQMCWRSFVDLLQQAVEAGRAAELSDHPTTQAVLAQIQAEQRQ
jgi:tetratricopeptide (TPR) repeat protein